jgi:hypothetical protein
LCVETVKVGVKSGVSASIKSENIRECGVRGIWTDRFLR